MNPIEGSLDSDRAAMVFDDVGNDGTNYGIPPHDGNEEFTIQRLALDKAVSPLLERPTAPFDRTERKKAHTSAVYYSECFIHGIEPVMADTAAVEAQGKYDKWWIKSTASRRSKDDRVAHKRPSNDCEPRGTRSVRSRKTDEASAFQVTGNQDHVSVISANAVSVSSCVDSHFEAGGRGHQSSDDDESLYNIHTDSACKESDVPMHQISTLPTTRRSYIEAVKNRMIENLRSSGGSVETPRFLECLEVLQTYYARVRLSDSGDHLSALEGNWLTLSKPTYTEFKGKNDKEESLYSLGRISFDMFRPTGLLCSVQASFNNVHSIDPKDPGRPLHVPRKLMHDISKGECKLQTYDIVVAVTVEAGQDRKGNLIGVSSDADARDIAYTVPRPIRGILTTQGYSIPDPNVPNRLSIWFSGGSLEVQDETTDVDEWKRIFDADSAPDRELREHANILAAKVLLGALIPEKLDADGTMNFSLKRPIGGHGSVYVDILFMDDTFRVMRGHHGSVYVCIRVPEPMISMS